MKQETPALVAFITDYKLEKPGGIICFTASIHFHSEKTWMKFISQVNVITILLKHLDVIYLLNPEISDKKIKTMYTNHHRFVYSKNRRFEIKGRSKYYGMYSVTIIPINNQCGEETIIELHSKKYN